MPGELLEEGGHATRVPVDNIPQGLHYPYIPQGLTDTHLPDMERLGLAMCTVWLVTVTREAPCVSMTRLMLRTETWALSPESRICDS